MFSNSFKLICIARLYYYPSVCCHKNLVAILRLNTLDEPCTIACLRITLSEVIESQPPCGIFTVKGWERHSPGLL